MEPDERSELAEDIAAEASRLESFAYGLTRDRTEAEDLAQETITRALANQARFTPGTNLRGWLYTIARNLHLSSLRRTSRRRIVSTDDVERELPADPGVLDPVERDVLARAETREVMAAFQTLPAIFAEPLRLTAVDELSYKETALRLGVPVGTVMSRIYRGRRLLLKRLHEGDR